MSEDESTRGERCPDCGGLYALVGHSRGIRWSLLGRSLCGAIASIRRAGHTALAAGTGPRNGRMAGSGSAGRNTPSRLNNALLQLKRLLNSEITPPTCARTVMSAAGGSCHRGVRAIRSGAPLVDVRSPIRPRVCADLEKFVRWKSRKIRLATTFYYLRPSSSVRRLRRTREIRRSLAPRGAPPVQPIEHFR